MSEKTTKLTQLDVETGTATSTAAAATINAQTGVVTTEALTTAASATYTFVLTNSTIASGSIVLVSVAKGTATNGKMVPTFVTPTTGSATIILQNIDTAAVNGTVKIGFKVEQVA